MPKCKNCGHSIQRIARANWLHLSNDDNAEYQPAYYFGVQCYEECYEEACGCTKPELGDSIDYAICLYNAT